MKISLAAVATIALITSTGAWANTENGSSVRDPSVVGAFGSSIDSNPTTGGTGQPGTGMDPNNSNAASDSSSVTDDHANMDARNPRVQSSADSPMNAASGRDPSVVGAFGSSIDSNPTTGGSGQPGTGMDPNNGNAS